LSIESRVDAPVSVEANQTAGRGAVRGGKGAADEDLAIGLFFYYPSGSVANAIRGSVKARIQFAGGLNIGRQDEKCEGKRYDEASEVRNSTAEHSSSNSKRETLYLV
jgi:hypothetical protein